MQKLVRQALLPETTSKKLELGGHRSESVPKLSPTLALVVRDVQRSRGVIEDSVSELTALVKSSAERIGVELSPIERDEVLAYLEYDAQPFGILQPLVDDKQVTDIIVTSYSKVSVQQGRKNYATDLQFAGEEEYEAFVERLLLSAGTSYSTRKPVADGMIGSYARIHAVHRCLCETGPYLTIRLNRYHTVTIDDLADSGLAPKAVLSYLSLLVRRGLTVLVVGEVGTGKTTLVRALAGAIPRDESILVIEDTPEIKLEHPHVRYLTTRESNSEGSGRIAPSECIRAGMRMAMNRIVFGEIRDAEAAEAFIDVCASGHPGISTLHARCARDALVRLELFLGRAQRGAAHHVLSEQVATAVQLVVFVNVCPVTGKRRIFEVHELGSVADGAIRYREMFRYEPSHSKGGTQSVPRSHWKVVSKASGFRDLLEQGEEALYLSELPQILEDDLTPTSLKKASPTLTLASEKER